MLFSNINVFCSKTWNWSGLSFSRSHWCKAVMGRAMWKKRLRGHAKATKALTRLRFRAVWSGPLVSIYRITAESINGGQSPGWSCAHAQDDMNNIPHMLTQIAIFPWRGPFNDSQFSSFWNWDNSALHGYRKVKTNEPCNEKRHLWRTWEQLWKDTDQRAKLHSLVRCLLQLRTIQPLFNSYPCGYIKLTVVGSWLL